MRWVMVNRLARTPRNPLKYMVGPTALAILVHISPWEATEGLIAGAARLLEPGGALFLYGPYRRADTAIAPSNAAFDASLRSRDPRWGLRDLEAVVGLAETAGFALKAVHEMPANNLSIVLRRA